jgi:hypothetical protein
MSLLQIPIGGSGFGLKKLMQCLVCFVDNMYVVTSNISKIGL